jgi:hypothetical protein
MAEPSNRGSSFAQSYGSAQFKVGDIVALAPAISRNVPGGVYEANSQSLAKRIEEG